MDRNETAQVTIIVTTGNGDKERHIQAYDPKEAHPSIVAKDLIETMILHDGDKLEISFTGRVQS